MMVFTRCAASELKFGVLREVVARERQRALFISLLISISWKAW